MTFTLLLDRTRDVTEDTWVDVVSPRNRARVNRQMTMDEALDALRAALEDGTEHCTVFETEDIRPVDDLDAELSQLAAAHWDN